MFLALKRIFKLSWISFCRNQLSTVSAIFVIFLTLFIITAFFFFQGLIQFLTLQIQEKIDISLYFNEEVLESEILKIETKLSQLPEVKDIKYVSKDAALEKFLEKHKENSKYLQVIDELGENPFLAALNVKVWEKDQYEKVLEFLEKAETKDLIDHHNFFENKSLIEKIYSLNLRARKTALLVSSFFVLITVLVVFNTTRLAIYNQRKEISIMRQIGASNFYIRAPFLLQGIIFGFFAFLICLFVWGGLSFLMGENLESFLGGFNFFDYFVENFQLLCLIQIGSGVGLGIISSFICTEKYLKI